MNRPTPTLELVVRPARPDDAARLADFNLAMARETEGKALDIQTVTAGVNALLRAPEHGFYLVAEQAGTVAGALLVTFEWSDWRNGMFWWIQSVYVDPPYRRRGLYRRLHGEVRRLGANRGNVCGIRLYVEEDNHRAQTTYRQIGMRATLYRVFEESPIRV